MNLKTIALMLAAVVALGACGDKQDQNLDTDYSIVTRDNEQGDSQFAVVEGSFDSVEGVQQYVDANQENIAWTNTQNASFDDELQLADDQGVQTTHHTNNRRQQRRHRRMHRRGQYHQHGWRPYSGRPWRRVVVRPRFTYRCNYNRIWWNGRCRRFYSPVYSNFWWSYYGGWHMPYQSRPGVYQTSNSWWYVRVWR